MFGSLVGGGFVVSCGGGRWGVDWVGGWWGAAAGTNLSLFSLSQQREQQDKAAEMGHRFPGRTGRPDRSCCIRHQHIFLRSSTGRPVHYVQHDVQPEETNAFMDPQFRPVIYNHRTS
ncbi:hypothetical protein INR49_020131 [Caranx melampygus]|nr:hypothetical protein INR49_020131 [Caranx melampygus]